MVGIGEGGTTRSLAEAPGKVAGLPVSDEGLDGPVSVRRVFSIKSRHKRVTALPNEGGDEVELAGYGLVAFPSRKIGKSKPLDFLPL